MLTYKGLMWWLVSTASFILTGYSIYAVDGFNYVLKTDSTFISLGIVVLYFFTTVVLGYFIHKKPIEQINLDKFWFISGLMTNLGLIGTLVGLAITFSIFVFGGGLTDDNTRQVSSYIASGTGAAITTTLVGLIYSVFLQIQLTILEKPSNE